MATPINNAVMWIDKLLFDSTDTLKGPGDSKARIPENQNFALSIPTKIKPQTAAITDDFRKKSNYLFDSIDDDNLHENFLQNRMMSDTIHQGPSSDSIIKMLSELVVRDTNQTKHTYQNIEKEQYFDTVVNGPKNDTSCYTDKPTQNAPDKSRQIVPFSDPNYSRPGSPISIRGKPRSSSCPDEVVYSNSPKKQGYTTERKMNEPRTRRNARWKEERPLPGYHKKPCYERHDLQPPTDRRPSVAPVYLHHSKYRVEIPELPPTLISQTSQARVPSPMTMEYRPGNNFVSGKTQQSQKKGPSPTSNDYNYYNYSPGTAQPLSQTSAQPASQVRAHSPTTTNSRPLNTDHCCPKVQPPGHCPGNNFCPGNTKREQYIKSVMQACAPYLLSSKPCKNKCEAENDDTCDEDEQDDKDNAKTEKDKAKKDDKNKKDNKTKKDDKNKAQNENDDKKGEEESSGFLCSWFGFWCSDKKGDKGGKTNKDKDNPCSRPNPNCCRKPTCDYKEDKDKKDNKKEEKEPPRWAWIEKDPGPKPIKQAPCGKRKKPESTCDETETDGKKPEKSSSSDKKEPKKTSPSDKKEPEKTSASGKNKKEDKSKDGKNKKEDKSKDGVTVDRPCGPTKADIEAECCEDERMKKNDPTCNDCWWKCSELKRPVKLKKKCWCSERSCRYCHIVKDDDKLYEDGKCDEKNAPTKENPRWTWLMEDIYTVDERLRKKKREGTMKSPCQSPCSQNEDDSNDTDGKSKTKKDADGKSKTKKDGGEKEQSCWLWFWCSDKEKDKTKTDDKTNKKGSPSSKKDPCDKTNQEKLWKSAKEC